jgi:outer membrane protein TolC
MQPSNPELGFDRQSVDGSNETEITIGKTFEMPWISLKRRSAWSERLRSAEQSAEESRVLLLSELKAGYATLKLFDAQLSRLTHIREVLTDASHVATTRHTEGHLSGIENHLIQMTVISLQTQHQRALAERRAAEIQWRILLGAGPEQGIALVTPIDFVPVSPGNRQDYTQFVENRPGYQSRQTLQHALSMQASAERARIIPSFNLYGGYKSIDPGNNGYVIGASFSLPFLNTNRATARKFDFERNLASNEAQRYRSEQLGRISNLVTSINEARETLALSHEHFKEDMEALDDLLFSYEEGWLTLSELLNAVQIEVTGLTDYFGHLVRYYQNIFELEAITGQTLVQFE